jgi:hypothetical protein
LFNDYKEGKIIEVANKYVDEYNIFERKQAERDLKRASKM